MMHVDHEPMAVPDLPVAVRMAVRLRAFPALVHMPVMLVMAVQVLVQQGRMLVLEQLGIGGWPQMQREAARDDHEQSEEAEGPHETDRAADHAGDEVG